jgi:hypothetical protein
MFALGQKQTYALQQAMSALHPIATAKADMQSAAAGNHVSASLPKVTGRVGREQGAGLFVSFTLS